MYSPIVPTILNINFNVLTGLIAVCLMLMVVLFVFIVVAVLYKAKAKYNTKTWQVTIAQIISQAIFEDEPEDLTPNTRKLLLKSAFKNCIIKELIRAKRNLSGLSTDNIKKLYEELELNNFSSAKLHSPKWHIKAKGIQELAILEQKKYVKEIFKLTNDTNELVRNEAQCALVNIYGYFGLRFLNVTKYPLSCWQQIQLLNILRDAKPNNIDALKKWLKSSNESVRVFALKLAANCNCYDMYEDVLNCLQSNSLHIRSGALAYFIKLPRKNTAAHLIAHFNFDNKAYKLTIIDVLKDIGNENDINFLLKQLHNNDDDIKIAAAKSLAILHPLGVSFLLTHLFADEEPWKVIFRYIENERAA